MTQGGDQLPASGWRSKPLGDLLERIEAGNNFTCEARVPTAGEVGIVKVSAVTWGEYDESETKTVTETSRINERLFVRPGDFLFSRANTIQLVGACVIARNVTKRVMLSDKILRFVLREVDPRWVLHFLRSPQGRNHIEQLSTGNQESMRNIGQQRIRSIPVPYPGRDTQQAVADEIEKQMSRIEAGVAALQRVQANLKRYRASVLKAACEGRLVPTEAELARKERRDYEPADVLIRRILVERRKRWEEAELAKLKAKGKPPGDSSWKKKYEEPKPPDTSELPDLPEGWCWASVDAVCTRIVDCLHKTPTYTETGYPAIRTADVVPGRLLLEQARRVDEATYQERVSRLDPLPGDVLYTREGERYGLAAVVPDGIRLCLSQRMMQFRVVRPLSPEFFMWALNSPFVYAQATRDVGGSTSPHVNIGSIRDFPVPIAPLHEQRRIAATLDDIFSVGEKTSDVARANIQRAASLRQSILRAAFSGKLLRPD